MKTVKLNWKFVEAVRVLYEKLRPEDHYKKTDFPQLNGYGIYMFLNKDPWEARYIGQAPGKSSIALQIRVRWEIVKDGKNGYTESAFYQQCKRNNVDKFDLHLKVAHLENPQQDGNNINLEVDYWVRKKFLNAIEGALIFKQAQAGNRLMNKTWVKSYGLGPIEISNDGDKDPLPTKISFPAQKS